METCIPNRSGRSQLLNGRCCLRSAAALCWQFLMSLNITISINCATCSACLPRKTISVKLFKTEIEKIAVDFALVLIFLEIFELQHGHLFQQDLSNSIWLKGSKNSYPRTG